MSDRSLTALERHLQTRVATLEAELERFGAMYDREDAKAADCIAELEDDAERLIDLVALLSDREGLAASLCFYAAPESYFAVSILTDPPCGDFSDDFSETEFGQKPGRRARIALGWEQQEAS